MTMWNEIKDFFNGMFPTIYGSHTKEKLIREALKEMLEKDEIEENCKDEEF